MTITTVNRMMFRTSDGTEYPSKEEALQHEFKLALQHWATANLYSGMLPHEVADALFEGRKALANIFEEYL